MTLNSGRGSNIKYYPYAFTIDGIDVLSTILYGDSIKDNYIKIFNYFNKTNDIVDSENTSISSNILGKFIETVKYEVDNISIDINVSREENTIWLTQADMSILFDTSIPNISMHIQNIMESYSTLKNSVFKKSLTTESVKNVMRLSTDGKTYNVQYYNLDIVISVGYRINSDKANIFRIWANSILKDYITQEHLLKMPEIE